MWHVNNKIHFIRATISVLLKGKYNKLSPLMFACNTDTDTEDKCSIFTEAPT